MLVTQDLESTLTDRYQTTVPEGVRKALKLSKRDKIHYTIRPSGEVVLTKAAAFDEDPVLGSFLNYLAKDIAQHPDRLQVVDAGLVKRIKSLVDGVELDLNAPLSDDDE
ncbi:MAG: type II toxin-antitoxin system PrlF family antitoxin [Pseudomonadota bacterium]|nr:type II toxin-antitoxin system PrlF family antitoxin [Pseudomonadota bacterium]